MLNILISLESNLALQMTLLLGGVATFCAAVLSRANPLCAWTEWAAGGDDDAAS